MGGGARTGPCRKAESGEEPLKEFIREMTLRIERGAGRWPPSSED
jgi:hypothetical protein